MSTEFHKDIKDPNLSVIIDLPYPGRPVLIAFGGMVGALGIPPFEFFNLTKNLNVNKIYLRDLNQTWYHSGLPEISENIDETASFLRRKVVESGANKIVVFGNSMGGYAAIVFGILIKADIVHAFSPHTFINDIKYIRSKKQIQYVHDNFSNKYFNLKNFTQLHDNLGKFYLYYDYKDKIDKKHAMLFKTSRNFALHSFRGGGHGLIKILKESGELQKIIISSLTNTPHELINTGTKNSPSCLARLFGAN